MSGGRYNYAYWKVEDFADELAVDSELGCGKALRTRFAEHCQLVARAMRACEWNDSGDGDDEEESLIRRVLCLKDVVD